MEKWFADFKRGRTDTDDPERSGRSIEVVSPENIKKVYRIVLENRKVKSHETADTLKLSEGSVHTISHEHLSIRKLFSK